jgi:hypothetical protein
MRVLVFPSRQPSPMSNRAQDIPLYNLTEAALWVGVPTATMHSWAYGRHYLVAGRRKRSRPLFKIADPEGKRLSFTNMAEAHLLAATRKSGIAMADVRAAIDFVKAGDSSDHPLLTGKFYKSGKYLA